MKRLSVEAASFNKAFGLESTPATSNSITFVCYMTHYTLSVSHQRVKGKSRITRAFLAFSLLL